MAKVNVGQDKQARLLAGTGTVAGYAGTATATSATSLTATGTPWSVNAHSGRLVFAANRFAVIISNTSSVLTIDQWLDPATPTGAAASTPSGTSTFIIFGEAPVFYMALTANGSAPAGGDTALTGEITTAGLKRQAAAYAHTTSATTYTLTGSYTAQSGDVGSPVTVAKIGTFDTLTGATGIMLHETLLSATATLSAAGDQLTVTQTVTM